MKALFRLLVAACLTVPALGCPAEIGSQNKNMENEDRTEHDEFGNVKKPAQTTPESK